MSKKNKKKVAFTGGGTAGHVFPAFPVIRRISNAQFDVLWIGSKKGMEKKIVTDRNIEYFGISSGKLRRYFSLRNFIDVFFIFFGFLQSLIILKKHRPELLFSKGGFVSVPPVLAARFLGIPCLTHESDVTLGLSTRLNIKFGAYPLLSFEKSLDYLVPSVRIKATVVGNPVRDEIFEGHRDYGRRLAGLQTHDTRPLLLVMGGSQGAKEINNLIFDALPELLEICAIVHQTGSGNPKRVDRSGYISRPFFDKDLPHFLSACDLAVSRSGAGSLWEMAGLGIPTIFIPLRTATRGDQILNAKLACEIGFAVTLDNNPDAAMLISMVKDILGSESRRINMKHAAGKLPVRSAADNIFSIIQEYLQ